ncbi:MAG: ribose 5-phosphate isomerase B [Bacilli bacterium]
MKISIGSDHGGFHLKQEIVKYLQSQKIEVVDSGAYNADSVDYPLYAEKVCKDIQSNNADFGILICTTGIGMCISANKFHGIRAALVHQVDEAESARRHNNANVLCFGEKYTTVEVAQTLIHVFINTPFDGGRHLRRINIITKQEEQR